jgi:pimeloyl-ACP methyl ester carboxylesterase
MTKQAVPRIRRSAWRRLWTCVKWTSFTVGALVLLALVAGRIYQWWGERRDSERFPAPGQMVDVGRFRLHLNCTGAGTPTVIFDNGLASNFLTWAAVQPEVASFTRACSYDRAGVGWSDPGPFPRTGTRIVGELSTMLANASIRGPFVLVGHSLGGLYVRLFAFEHPTDVAGLVLVDPSHEDQLDRLPPTPAVVDDTLRAGLALAPYGLARVFAAQLTPPNAPTVSPELRAMETAGSVRTNALRAAASEFAAVRESSEAVRRARRPLGDVPLVVLSAAQIDPVPGMDPEDARRGRQIFRELHEEIVRSSTQGRLVVAEKSGHVIQSQEPELIVETIRGLVTKTAALPVH